MPWGHACALQDWTLVGLDYISVQSQCPKYANSVAFTAVQQEPSVLAAWSVERPCCAHASALAHRSARREAIKNNTAAFQSILTCTNLTVDMFPDATYVSGLASARG